MNKGSIAFTAVAMSHRPFDADGVLKAFVPLGFDKADISESRQIMAMEAILSTHTLVQQRRDINHGSHSASHFSFLLRGLRFEAVSFYLHFERHTQIEVKEDVGYRSLFHSYHNDICFERAAW